MTLNDTQINCLRKSERTFGYREIDASLPTFKYLEGIGLVYQTVRAFYITDAGRAVLAEAPAMSGNSEGETRNHGEGGGLSS